MSLDSFKSSTAHEAAEASRMEQARVETLGAPASELVEAIACRVVELLREGGEGPALLDTGEVARRLGRSADWVRDHRAELGAVPLGSGPRPRLGYPAERVAAYSQGSRSVEPESGQPKRREPNRRHRRRGQNRDLLPIRGRRAAP